MGDKFPYPESKLWQAACKAENKEERQSYLRQIFKDGGYVSTTDYPASLFVEDLVEMYPEAKFVHCERSSPQVWRESVNETIGKAVLPSYRIPAMALPRFSLSMYPTLMAMDGCARRTRGGGFYGSSTDVALYHAHNAWVKEVVPKDRMLFLDAKDGYGPLCEFLGVPVPKDENGRELAYPHVNEREALRKGMAGFRIFGWTIWAVGLASIVGAGVAVRRWGDLSKLIRW